MDIKDYARKILADHNCTEESYEGVSVETTIKDLNEGYPDGMEYPISEVAQAISDISNTDRGYFPPIKVEFENHCYTSHWGLDDLYPDVEQKLKEVIATGMPFETECMGAKKEIVSSRISRKYKGGDITIEVSAAMDEGYDLISDAIPNGSKLTKEDIDNIHELYFCNECEPDTEITLDGTVTGNSTLEQVLEKANELWQQADDQLKENFEDVKSWVKHYEGLSKEELKELLSYARSGFKMDKETE